MSTYELLADLPLTVDAYALEGLELSVSPEFTRKSTVIHLSGGGIEGVGEDVVYQADEQEQLQAAGANQPVAGEWTLGDFCAHVDGLDLFPVEPAAGETSRLYRRWAFHSAALDLALRQAGRPLHEVLGRPLQPLTFVVSMNLGEPPSLDRVTALLARYPTVRLKLDARPSWDDALVAALQATGAVDTLDYKGFYRNTPVDNSGEPAWYRRLADAFPHAWIEDPDLEAPGTDAALASERDRITWDAPIHSIADIEALPFPPRMVNIKPSRLGGLERLCDAYDYCAEHGIRAYGGGQFELGAGRGQAQYLAAIFHPDTPNDLAPSAYNEPAPADGLPSSPLTPRPSASGFRWES
jgi:L-alanine-DL-glutamate epimerase-like enolase superfamily enzyme